MSGAGAAMRLVSPAASTAPDQETDDMCYVRVDAETRRGMKKEER